VSKRVSGLINQLFLMRVLSALRFQVNVSEAASTQDLEM
jgi:hypothetical protein